MSTANHTKHPHRVPARMGRVPRPYGGYEHWRNYYDGETLERGDALREVHAIRSAGATIHMDVYPRPEREAPVVVFNHGAAGYCRMFVRLALEYHGRGYSVVLPDQRGQGLSGGRRGDYTVAEATQNIVDASRWAKARFGGPLFVAGGSVGGGLAYYAAAAGAPADAVACVNLVDFSTTDSWGFSMLAPLARVPGMPAISRLGMKALGPLRGVRIPFSWVGRFGKLVDRRDGDFQALWDADPVPPRLVSLRYLASASGTAPAVSLEENEVPALVINQKFDEMVDVGLTRRNYERLGGPKRYLEVPFGHWSSKPEFWRAIAEASNEWFEEHAGRRWRA